ncbi:MAG: MFS transporter [Anaerolineae bacterium]|jgi:Na+/melibiose symporter-like transporter|nr:MFS transporter [Anaerolineae bacterium]MDH7474700.1 MFS transporter [Anaerolineae bacterium]
MRKRDYVAINVYWFGLAFMWNGLHPIVLPALLLNFVPESLKNTYLGGMTFAGLIVAMIIQPLSGALSDRTRSRWGRRRPWMLAGTLLDLVFLAGMALAGGYWGLLAAYILLQVTSNAAHGPAQGLIPDLVPEERRGLASGIKNLFDMGGLVVASLVMGRLAEGNNQVLTFAVIGGILVVSTLITLLGTSERPATVCADPASGSNLRDLWRADFRRYPDYAWLIVSRFLILLGIYAVQGFVQYYIRDFLGVPNPAEVTGNLMAIIGLALTALVFPAGLLSDRLGRKPLNLLAGALAALGIFLLIFVRSVTSLLVFGGIIGMATGIFVSVNWALATDLIPQEEAGKYLGLSNLATAGSGAASRLAGPLIDGLNALRPGAYLGYPTLFLLASASTLLGTLLILRIRKSPHIS